MENFVALITYLAIFVGTWVLAKKRGRNPWRWFFASILFSFLPIIYLLCTSPVSNTSEVSDLGSNDNGSALSGREFHEALVGLQGVGEKTAIAIMGVYPRSYDLVGSTIDELKSIEGVSQTNAEVILQRFG